MRIAIVKLSALGDIIHAMVALQFIKQSLPDSSIDWIVEEGFKDLLIKTIVIQKWLFLLVKFNKSTALINSR